MQIREFVVGEEITTFLLVKQANVKTTNNNKTYMDFNFTDITGEINGKIWDVRPEMMDTLKAGTLVKVQGTVTLWQSQQQLKVIRIRPVDDNDKVVVENYVPAAPIRDVEMLDEVMTFVSSMESQDIKGVIERLLKDYQEEILYYPAAKSNHHAIKSGLLYHMIRMLRSGDALCKIYTNLKRDLVIAGVILHDIEKINEMKADKLGIVSEYTRDGQLLGHIIMGIKKVDQICSELGVDEELSVVLQHLVLTHHYEPEFGSPKKPMIPEGEILHQLDMIDARMYDMDKVLTDMEDGDFSDPVFVLDRRRLYKY